MAEKGANTSEFRFAGLIGLLTLGAEHINIFDTEVFSSDPVLSLIFRGVQLLVLGGIAVAYIFSRTSIKVSNGTSTEDLAKKLQRNLDQKR
jgi:hypothetical protein